jgi:hypothetical protein
MNARQRFIETMKYGNPDRIPLVEWHIRESTLREWHRQGLTVTPEEYLSLDPYSVPVPIDLGHCPKFEPVILEEYEDYKIWIDEEGATRKDFEVDKTPGFVTRKWIKFPVENREDFERMKRRYDPSTDERYPGNWGEMVGTMNRATAPVSLTIPFLFWTTRQWMGFENTCLCFYDDPDLMMDMMNYITDFIIEVLKRGIDSLKIDLVLLNEDMAYKTAPMISPEMFRKFMFPSYRKLADYLRSCGVKFILVDSDGNPEPLIPLWLEAGMDGFSPVEVAAGVDPVKLKKEYGRDLLMMGGIDKRILARSKDEIYEEVMRKVPYLIEQGGYIPHTDHAVPPDVPLSNFVYYRELVRKVVQGEI